MVFAGLILTVKIIDIAVPRSPHVMLETKIHVVGNFGVLMTDFTYYVINIPKNFIFEFCLNSKKCHQYKISVMLDLIACITISILSRQWKTTKIFQYILSEPSTEHKFISLS